MKKNLRIVSAAAAALLAVAPVAATAIATPATTVSAVTTTEASTKGTITAANVKYAKETEAAFTGSKEAKINAPKLNVSGVATPVDGVYKSGSVKLDGSKPSETKDVTTGSHVISADYTYTLANATTAVTAATIGGKSITIPSGVKTITVTFSKTVIMAAQTPSASENINGDSNSVFYGDANVAVNINAIAGLHKDGTPLIPGNAYGEDASKGSVSGNITATLDCKSYTGMISNDSNGQNITFTNAAGQTVKASELRTRTPYTATFSNVAFNLGNAYSNKEVTLTLPSGVYFGNTGTTYTKKFTADVNGVVNTGNITVRRVYALDPTDMKGINFYEVKSGNVVNSGSVNMNAVNGQLNVESVYAAVVREYGAAQVFNDKHSQDSSRVSFLNNLRDQLTKQNIKVDANGYFTAPASFSINMTARSNYNGAEATLPVTVNVSDATASNTNTNETTKNVTIMHISTIYDKNGKATHDAALRAYNSVSVVSDPVTLKDENGKDAGRFYKLAGQDRYIKVGNVDGTSRTLKHNSYVYKSTGKRANKKTLKSGSSVTTYGKSFMIAGHQMYKIGRNQYVKKANF